MARDLQNSVTIIKRKKVVAEAGHHGGAWKVAYADFVTAMMAFFLLMWLLNATTEDQRKGIADYFNPTIPVHKISGGGDGMFHGESIFAQQDLAHTGRSASGHLTNRFHSANGLAGPLPPEDLGGEIGRESEQFGEIETLMRGDSGESVVEDDLLQQVITRVTDEGLIIEVFDVPGSPLFVGDTSEPGPKLTRILALISEVSGLVRNSLAVSGHVDTSDALPGEGFAMTSDRAQAARRMLQAHGLEAARIARVTGEADRRPAFDGAPPARNRRLEIVLLRRDPGAPAR